MIPITSYEGESVAIFGLGRSGVAAAKALSAGGARVHAWDESEGARAGAREAGVNVEDINRMDWRDFAALVLAPGVAMSGARPHRIVELANAVGTPIIGEVELFARQVNALAPAARPSIVGIAGAVGKTSTALLLASILRHAGKDVHVSTDTSILDLAPLHAGAIYVLELSSTQLALSDTLRCNVSVLLNVTADQAEESDLQQRVFDNQGAGDWAVVGVDARATAAICTALVAANTRVVAPVSCAQALGRGVCTLGGALYDALDGRAVRAVDLSGSIHHPQTAGAAYAAARALRMTPRAIAEAMAIGAARAA